ncbi:MAG: hypothetical protein IT379_01060 [Deltaproteobacteria bacterium]|nr:hypothetical protein [Deltaproteobacteria bacterium]
MTRADPLVTEPFVCMDCASRQPDPGECRRCGSGPMLDARDPEVRNTLLGDDERRARKREGLVIGASVLAAIPIVVGLELALPLFEALLRVGGCFGELIASGALAVVLWQVGRRVWPFRHRFAFLRSG